MTMTMTMTMIRETTTDVNRELQEKHGIHPACGCFCPPGWYKLVDQLLTDLSALDGFHPDMVVQVKSKFCGLRFYLDGEVPEEAREMIRAAEAKSYETCELCGGTPTDTSPTMWGMRLCGPCEKAREAYRTR